MVKQGLVLFIQTQLANLSPPVVVPGGFADELPKDLISAAASMAWSYRTITEQPGFHLEGGESGWNEWTVQIDCYGNTAADREKMLEAIIDVMRPGFRGRLTDPDATLIFNWYRTGPAPSGFTGDTNRIYVQSLEYVIEYQRQTS